MTELAELAEALRERGFGVTHAVRVADYGHNKIMVIKAVRELTHWGLKDAKDAVEGYATIIDGVSLAAAEHAAAKLKDAGAKVEIGVGELHLHAFAPADPRRGDQPLERIRVVDLGLALDHGRLGAWQLGLAVPRSVPELLADIDEQRHAWAQAGKREATTELAILEQLSAREPALEDRLRTSDGEARRREAAVYGDWLQAQADPRGLIAAVALAGEEAELERLAAEHGSHLFGPSLRLVEAARWTWLGPILDTLVLEPVTRDGEFQPPPTCERLAELLATPACSCLRSLSIDRPIDNDVALGELLSAAACAPGLRELRYCHGLAVTLRGDALSRLETLTLAGRLTLGPIQLPALRRLDVVIEVPLAPLAASFTDFHAPALEHLTLSVRSYDYWDQNYGPMQSNLCTLLSQPSFARLRTLTIGAGCLFVGFADSLARIPAITTLERIDLRESEMTDDCRAELERHRDRLPGLLL